MRHEREFRVDVDRTSDLDLLEGTRRVLLERGLCRCELQDHEGRVCLMGAMIVHERGLARGLYPDWDAQTGKSAVRLTRLLGFELTTKATCHWVDAVHFSNRSTQDQVVARLDEAIARIRG